MTVSDYSLPHRPKVALLSVNTGSYASFFEVLFPYNFNMILADCDVTWFLFTDNENLLNKYYLHPAVKTVITKHEAWPMATLKRFDYFTHNQQLVQILEDYEYIFFLNANFYARKPILAKDILIPNQGKDSDLVVLTHFMQQNIPEEQRSFERNPESLACVPYGEGKHYLFGAFYGGTSQAFLKLCQVLKQRIEQDYAKGIIALWHDESHLNRYIYDLNYQVKILDPSFCLPQEIHPRCYNSPPRTEVKAVLLDKNALPNKADTYRNAEQHLLPCHVELMVFNEESFRNHYRDNFAECEEERRNPQNLNLINRWQIADIETN